MSEVFQFVPGTTPVLISVPHAGTTIPAEIAARMTTEALDLPDTDWHVPLLYDFARQLGAGLIVATHSRYVIDLNRDPSGKPLYPGADNTELVPLTTFNRDAVYRSGLGPDDDEVAQRVSRYWRPYHDKLAGELETLKARHGVAVLWDAHSIPSMVPRFFRGKLPDLNLGSAKGTSAAPDLIEAVARMLKTTNAFSSVVDGRFTGGYITRRFGQPRSGVHALQLELGQACYMDESPPYRFDAQRAAPLKALLEKTIEVVVAWARAHATVSP
ncbi:MAG TPA: N-formylglutamate deformylase [Alphaproteobacteria bacterium]|nr:N-formylglutamate deformylase [Alphaproteobacteria bacterium]